MYAIYRKHKSGDSSTSHKKNGKSTTSFGQALARTAVLALDLQWRSGTGRGCARRIGSQVRSQIDR